MSLVEDVFELYDYYYYYNPEFFMIEVYSVKTALHHY